MAEAVIQLPRESGTSPAGPRGRRWPWTTLLIWGAAAGVVAAAGLEAVHVLAGRNFHTVVPGNVYRSAQLTGAQFEQLIRQRNIRTVVNLRGCCDTFPWYLDECRAAQRTGAAHEDINLSACRLPPVHEMRRLVEVLDQSEYPVLIHCRRGSDRTGLVSVIYLLLHTDTPLATALGQLSPRYGHIPIGKTWCLNWFFRMYTDWLKAHGEPHSPARFRHWVQTEYCPGGCRCAIEPLEVPAPIAVGSPTAARVRVRNTSVRAWNLRPETNAGIHAIFFLTDEQTGWSRMERAGLFRATVAPGESVDLTLCLPSVPAPGRYTLLVDMIDEQQCWFFQTGSEPLQCVIDAR